MQTYMQVVDTLGECINKSYKTKEDKELFRECLRELSQEYKTEISTKFLRGLISNSLNERQKTYFIKNFLKSLGLKTERRIRFYNEWINQTGHVEVISYKEDKEGNVFIKNSEDISVGNFIKQIVGEVLYFLKGF